MYTVIIVDKEQPTVAKLKAFFANWQIKVEVYSDVESTLNRLQKTDDEQPILLVIDLQLHNSKGIEINDFMSQHERFRDIPRIMTSRDMEASSLAEHLTSGVEGFFFKPLNMDCFAQEVRSLVENAFPEQVEAIFKEKAS